MAKPRKRHYKKHVKTSGVQGGYMGLAKRAGCIIAGLAAGSFVKDFISQRTGTSGTDLLGLSGETSKYTTPAIVTAAGVAGATLLKNQMLKDVALGVVAAGGAGLVNAVMGKTVVGLGATEEFQTLPMLPGMGDVEPNITFDQLPSENEQVQTYNPVQEAGDIIEGVEPILL